MRKFWLPVEDHALPLFDSLCVPAWYQVAENELVREHGDAASGAQRDRQRFVRSCVGVQARFLQNHLTDWPWHPGEQENMDTATRAEKGRRSAAAFRRWMEAQRLTALATAPDRGARATAVGGTARAAAA